MGERTYLKVCPCQLKYLFYNCPWDVTGKVSDGGMFFGNNSPKEALDLSYRLHCIKKKRINSSKIWVANKLSSTENLVLYPGGLFLPRQLSSTLINCTSYRVLHTRMMAYDILEHIEKEILKTINLFEMLIVRCETLFKNGWGEEWNPPIAL